MTEMNYQQYHMYSKKGRWLKGPGIDWMYTECGMVAPNEMCAPADNVTCGNCKRTKRYKAYKSQTAEYEAAMNRGEAAMEL